MILLYIFNPQAITRQQVKTVDLPPGMRFLASNSVDWMKPPQAATITDVCWLKVYIGLMLNTDSCLFPYATHTLK